jgi:hypothetical protein
MALLVILGALAVHVVIGLVPILVVLVALLAITLAARRKARS